MSPRLSRRSFGASSRFAPCAPPEALRPLGLLADACRLPTGPPAWVVACGLGWACWTTHVVCQRAHARGWWRAGWGGPVGRRMPSVNGPTRAGGGVRVEVGLLDNACRLPTGPPARVVARAFAWACLRTHTVRQRAHLACRHAGPPAHADDAR